MDHNDQDFAKFFSRVFKLGFGAWIVAGLLSLGLWGVIIWAVISVVNHFT